MKDDSETPSEFLISFAAAVKEWFHYENPNTSNDARRAFTANWETRLRRLIADEIDRHAPSIQAEVLEEVRDKAEGLESGAWVHLEHIDDKITQLKGKA